MNPENTTKLHPMDEVHSVEIEGSDLAMILYAVRWWGNNCKNHPDLAPNSFNAAQLIKKMVENISPELKAELFKHEILK